MKIVKQMLMHLGTLYEKSYTRRAYSDSFTLHFESQFVSAASKAFTVPQLSVSDKTKPAWFPGFSDS